MDINYVVDKFKSKKADAQRQKDVNSRTLPGLDLRHVSQFATSGNGGKKRHQNKIGVFKKAETADVKYKSQQKQFFCRASFTAHFGWSVFHGTGNF